MKINHIGMLNKEAVENGRPINLEIAPRLFNGANNGYTSFPFRVAYLLWTLKGANLLEPLQYYGRFFDEYTDDGESLRGAYGPRLRYWVGPDALQEAIKKNQDIDMDSDDMAVLGSIARPVGVDQLNAVYEDLHFGMTESVMQIFDPAIDFEETNNVPDLHRISFLVNDGKIDMIMDYLNVEVNTMLINDLYVFEMIKYLMASFLTADVGNTYINIGRPQYNQLSNLYTEHMHDCTDESAFVGDYRFNKSPEDFWQEFAILLNFEKHLRMQINNKTFTNEEISVSELSHILIEKLLDTITIKILSDLGRSLFICAIIKHTDNIKLYKELILEEFKKLDNICQCEVYNYAIHTNTKYKLGL